MCTELRASPGPTLSTQASVRDVLRKRGAMIQLIRARLTQAITRTESNESGNEVGRHQPEVHTEQQDSGTSWTEGNRRRDSRRQPPPSSAEGFL
mmetsp:Transcript_42902/g.77951  ORF Transcript_42902/g.77951 Transcript_42902/m.77951 type:complete len:94 (-) Transcript_42902:24-305(-)